MLQAINRHGRAIILAHCSPKQVSQLRDEDFYCPSCKEKVIVRAGPKVIPHFAHMPHSHCRERMRAGESKYHQYGKWLLYNWLKYECLQPQLEKYLPTIKQRPDIFFSIKNKNIAVEFQSASITEDVINERNNGYKLADIFPLWILGYNQFPHYSRNTYRMKALLESCIINPNENRPATLNFFCPFKEKFYLLYDLIVISPNRALALKKSVPLQTTSLKQLFQLRHFSNESLYSLWHKEKRKFRLRPARPSRIDYSFRSYLYAKGLHIEQLPSAIYLPNRQQYKLTVPLAQWQSNLLLNEIVPLRVGGRIRFERCIETIKHYIKKQYEADVTQIINEYFMLLMQLGLLVKIGHNVWVKKKQPLFPRYIEEAIREDEKTIALLKRSKTILD